MTRTTRRPYDFDDIESIAIDVDKILGDESVEPRGQSPKSARRQQEVQEQQQKKETNSPKKHKTHNRSTSEELESTYSIGFWRGISQPIPEKSSFVQQNPPRASIRTDPPEDLFIRNYSSQYDDISATLTEDMFYGETSHVRPAKSLHQDARTIDGTTEASEDEKSHSITPTAEEEEPSYRRRQYKYAAILAVLLLFIICGLAIVLHGLLQNDQSNNSRSSQASATTSMKEEEQWTLGPSLAPYVYNPGNKPTPSTGSMPAPTAPTATSRPTRPPTPVPTKRPTYSPSASPTKSESGHLLDLLRYTTSEKTIEAIGIRGSPQQKAYDWLHKDPSYFAYTTTSKIQRFALAALYFSTVKSKVAKEALVTWMNYGTHECDWFTSFYDHRLPCSKDRLFKFLALRNLDLSGEIPSELGLLTNLVALVMNDNSLTGTIPQEFGEWSTLETLDLHGNSLTGRIPNLIGYGNLREIDLSLNMLTDFVPASIGNLNITSLDLSRNPNLQGVMPFELCARSDQIEVLAADCDKVFCTCCTRCGKQDTDISFTAPVATARPTPRLTAAPTMQPSELPIANTPAPTLNSACVDNIRTSKQCYQQGEPIEVIYSNCNPSFGDWIGIYGFNIPENALFDPLLSHRTCTTEPCSGVPQQSAIVLEESASWNTGLYNVFMFRGGSGAGPHSFFSKIQYIMISETCY